MKPQEVRIDNLIYSIELDLNTGKYNDIVTKVDYHILHHLVTGNYEGHKPIPLTEEWLIRFECEPKYGSFYLPQSNINVFITEDGLCNIEVDSDIWIGSIKYVHQLQNVYFALFGEELTLKQ